MRSLPKDLIEMKKSVYNALLYHSHPRITFLNRFDAAYRSDGVSWGSEIILDQECSVSKRSANLPGFLCMCPHGYMKGMSGYI